MLWIRIALLGVLVAIIGYMIFLFLVRNRNKVQGRLNIQPPPIDKASKKKVEMPVDSSKLPHTCPAEQSSLELINEDHSKASEPAHDTTGEDLHAQPPASIKHAELVSDKPVKESVPQQQTSDDGMTRELEVNRLGDLSDTRDKTEIEEHGDTTPEIITDGQEKTSAETRVPMQIPIARGEMPSSIERKPDTTTNQSITLTRSKARNNKIQKSKTTKKKESQQQSRRTYMEELRNAERLLAEVPEIVENIERHRQLRPPRSDRYRPPSQEPVTVSKSSGRLHPMRQEKRQSFDMIVRLLFQRSGHFRLGLLPRRGADSPEEILLGPEGNRYTVATVHDDWYEDIYPQKISELLVDGISWEGRIESEVLGYWSLSGRDLFVLAAHNDLQGFAQTTRLKIGREHVVLCRNPLLAEVKLVLHQAGCAGITILDESYGAPHGWVVIRGVVPTKVVRIDTDPAILSILQPAPELEIEFQGGIYLQQGTWLCGFPPCIRVCGDIRLEIEVFIDGNRAIAGDSGSFTNRGYDAIGEHTVSIPVANTSKSYRISEGEKAWISWDAYDLARVQLCGPLVLDTGTSTISRVVVVPSSNSVILGAKPGDIAFCPRIQGPKQVGCISFNAVWAIPYDAFGCNKNITTIRLLSVLRLVPTHDHKFTREKGIRVKAWSAAILNTSRKGLLVDMSDPHALVLWKEYKSHARSLWKMLKK